MSNGTDITRSISYQYGNNGLLSRRDYPNVKSVSYSYDAYGNCTTISAQNGLILWNLTDYTGTSTTSTITLSNSTPYVRTTRLDNAGNIQSRVMTRGSDTLQYDSYVFNAQTGNLTSRTLTGRSAETFTYDNLDRLTQITGGNQSTMQMTYSQNGNISTKNNMGQYSYSSTSKPHAVSSISPVSGIPEFGQYIEYTPWNKVEEIYHEEGDDYYYYHIEYGPDQQRVRSSLYKNGVLQNIKFYWDDYEADLYKNSNDDNIITWSCWIEAPDGLAGFYWNRSDEYYLAIHPNVAMTDNLGSLTGLYDHNGNKTLDATYDAWGKRTFAAGSMQLDRGFTGHEHIDALGLINMNGRMYDPLQGRFLSPDNYIQAPDNPQNYNRYSYCLNNPLKYTDPDGESILAAMAMALFAGGMTNVFIQANNNNIDNFGDAMNALVGGMAAVVSEATSWALGFAALSTGSPLGVLYGHAVNFAKSVNLTTTFVSSIMHPLNASKIVLGRYYTDENGDAWDQMVQGLSRFTWEGPQTWAGYNWSQMRSIAGKVDEVDYLGGATFCINEKGSFGSVSLGNYINADIRGDYQGSITKHPVLMHEYGHTFDSRKMGPMYLFTIGIPSAKSANNSKKINNRYTHSWYWSELRANRAAKKYFGKHYGIDWSIYENFVESEYYYPVERPVPQLLQKDYLEWYYSNY